LVLAESPHHFFEAYISDMGRPFSHLLGTVGMLLVMLLWLSLLNPPKADHLATVSPGHNTNTQSSWVQRYCLWCFHSSQRFGLPNGRIWGWLGQARWVGVKSRVRPSSRECRC
jgi:hypothetical protein